VTAAAGSTTAVLVLSHRAPDQLRRLVRRLEEGTRTATFVHHDPTGPELRGIGGSATTVLPDPVACAWGRASLVDAVVRSLEFIRRHVSDLGWVLVVSGQDYPVRRPRDIEAELAASTHDAWLRSFAVGDPADDVVQWQRNCRRRYTRSVRVPGSARGLPLPFPRPHPFRGDVRLHIGDMWVNLGRRAVDQVLDSPLRPRLRRYASTVPIPDEMFVPTLVHSATPGLDVAHGHRRFIEWTPADEVHPAVITAAHLPAIRASDAFFARKVDLGAHPEVADLLDDLAGSR
jgi:hypothetical protein